MTEKDIKLLYLFRDKLTRKLWDMNKDDNISKSQIIEFIYEKFTNYISILDERKI